jgi:hypothetical protein
MLALIHSIKLLIALGLIFQSGLSHIVLQRQVRQSREAVAAYRTCERFENLLGETLDFGVAYEATFTGDRARRRAIAIQDGEFGGVDLSKVDDASLISAYKSRMQFIYLLLVLASPDTDAQERLYFPVEMKKLMESKPPPDPREFPAYAARLERGARDFRAHLDQLAVKYPEVAERIRQFKSDLSGKKVLPATSKITPNHGVSRGEALKPNEDYYEIEGYTVIRENKEMKLAGIRFFTRLF